PRRRNARGPARTRSGTVRRRPGRLQAPGLENGPRIVTDVIAECLTCPRLVHTLSLCVADPRGAARVGEAVAGTKWHERHFLQGGDSPWVATLWRAVPAPRRLALVPDSRFFLGARCSRS